MPSSLPSPADFPDSWSPMLVKELRQALRQPFFVWPFVLIHFLSIAALALEWEALQSVASVGRISGLASDQAFWFVSFIILGFLMPLRAFDALQVEMTGGCNELLILAGQNRWKIVRGKCRAQMFLTLLTLCSLTPYMLLRYFFGGFDLWSNLACLAELFLGACSLTAVVVGGSGFKSLPKRLAFMVVGYLYLGILGMLSLSGFQHSGSTGFMEYLVLAVMACMQYALQITAQQVGRGHLKPFLSPWETSPSTSMTILFVASPVLLLVLAIVTAGIGAVFGLALMLAVLKTYDPDKSMAPRLRRVGISPEW